jgi:mRNA interferase RelE/StbE
LKLPFMTYKLTFLEPALKEWRKLPPEIQTYFKAQLLKKLDNPYTPKNKLAGMKDCYKLKLRNSGYRLVYQVIEERLVVQVIAMGKRDKNAAYNTALQRLSK